MKKKIVFMVINMNVGGTEKALLNIIAELPKDQFDITVLMLEQSGGFLKAIPKEVRIDYVSQYKDIKNDLQYPPIQVVLKHIKSGKMIRAFNIFVLQLISKLMKERSLLFKYILRDVPHYKNKYDLAIAYAGPVDLISYFIAYKVNARKKIQWIHFDINKIGFNPNFASKIYIMFDRLFVVSNEGRKKLMKKVPALNERTDVFSNLSSPQLIRKQALEGNGFQDNFNGIRILTVGRLSFEKGQDLAITVLSKLINEGFKVKWYCVGKGACRNKYEEMAAELNVRDYFVFLGEDPEPYHYMKQCDIYVQPSRHEGYCITLAEARALYKPIVTTNFTGAKEQIVNNKTGLIVNVDEDDIYQAVKKLIINPMLCEEFSKNLANSPMENKFEMEKLYKLI